MFCHGETWGNLPEGFAINWNLNFIPVGTPTGKWAPAFWPEGVPRKRHYRTSRSLTVRYVSHRIPVANRLTNHKPAVRNTNFVPPLSSCDPLGHLFTCLSYDIHSRICNCLKLCCNTWVFMRLILWEAIDRQVWVPGQASVPLIASVSASKVVLEGFKWFEACIGVVNEGWQY